MPSTPGCRLVADMCDVYRCLQMNTNDLVTEERIAYNIMQANVRQRLHIDHNVWNVARYCNVQVRILAVFVLRFQLRIVMSSSYERAECSLTLRHLSPK